MKYFKATLFKCGVFILEFVVVCITQYFLKIKISNPVYMCVGSLVIFMIMFLNSVLPKNENRYSKIIDELITIIAITFVVILLYQR